MKKIYISFLTLSLLQASNIHGDKSIILRHPIVEFIDGKSIGIHEGVIKLMIQVRGHIRRILVGTKLANGHYEGMFNFDGHLCSVHMLAKLEDKHEQEFKQKEAAILKNHPVDKNELEKVRTHHKEEKHKLHLLFEQAKQEFKSHITPFAKNARGAKHQMLVLIEEECKLRGRHNSLLLTWADTDEHTEMRFFDERVTTFKELEQFCIDLTHFLGDLMDSCPKAMAQYEKAKKNWNASH